jgi:hypothetical protein
MRRRVGLAAVLAILLALVAPETGRPALAGAGHQAAQPLHLEVRVGFDNYIQPETWTAVHVTASNDGDDISADIQVQVSPFSGDPAVYSRPIDLPSGSRKQVTLYVADVPSFSNDFEVRLVSRGRTLASEHVRVDFVSPTTLLVGVWSDNPQGLGGLGLVAPESGITRVAMLQAEDFPDMPRAWAGLDVLMISSADTGTLTPAQRSALQAWLASGGRLIIAGGIDFQRTLAGLGDVTPVQATGTLTVTVAPLAEAAGQPSTPQLSQQAPVSVGTLADDAVTLVDSLGIPLVAWREMGYGRVTFLAPDPALEPLRTWGADPAIWTYLLSQGDTRPAWAYGFYTWESGRQAVASVPGVSLPSVLQLCGFLAAYVVLIGPVNYLVLTRLKRRELAWLTIPALVVLFSATAYVTGFQLRGSRAILHRLAVIQSWSGSDVAEVDALLGIWSPRRSRYDLTFPPEYLVRPMPRNIGGALTSVSDALIEQGERVTLRGVRVDVASVQPFVVEGFTTEAPDIASDLVISPQAEGMHITGTVRNNSPLDLDNASIVFGGAARQIGDLAAGAQLRVDVTLAAGSALPGSGSALEPFPPASLAYSGYYYDTLSQDIAGGDCFGVPEHSRRCNLFNAVRVGQVVDSGVYLMGWSDSIPLEISVTNTASDSVDTGLHIIGLEARLQGDAQGLTAIPPGLMTWSLVGDTQTYVTPYSLYTYAGEVHSFRFEPLDLVGPVDVRSLIIHLTPGYEGDSQLAPPQVTIHNFHTGRWDIVQGLVWGETTVYNAQPYVDAAGGVEMSLSSGSDAYGISITRFDVTLFSTTLPED